MPSKAVHDRSSTLRGVCSHRLSLLQNGCHFECQHRRQDPWNELYSSESVFGERNGSFTEGAVLYLTLFFLSLTLPISIHHIKHLLFIIISHHNKLLSLSIHHIKHLLSIIISHHSKPPLHSSYQTPPLHNHQSSQQTPFPLHSSYQTPPPHNHQSSQQTPSPFIISNTSSP